MRGWVAAVVLGLVLVSPACRASPLGAVVTLEPSVQRGRQEVMAHTSVLVPEPCPARLEVPCEGIGCVTHVTPDPISGEYPPPGWCLWQWQSIVPPRHTSHQILGSTDVLLSSWADLTVRPDNRKVNRPPVAALLPPLRVNVNCFQKFNLSVKDPDGDQVRCRYGNEEQRECQICFRHEFLQLNETGCVLVYNGLGEPGLYVVELMVEDFLSDDINGEGRTLSSTPLQLSVKVERPAACKALPAFTESTPAGGAVFTVLPYEEMNFTAEARASSGRVSEIAVVGPPGLRVSALKTEEPGSLAWVSISWLRTSNELPQLLPVCFTANTKSLQSETRCVWIKQKPVDPLPPGTVLRCGNEEMNFSFPISSVPGVPLSDLRLNDPSCPVSHNSTHVMGRASLSGCGTRAVHSGLELVYTNTLRTLRPASPISRLPALVLQLSCRYGAAQVQGPHYHVLPVDEEETFGPPDFWMEFRPPDLLQDGILDLLIFSGTTLDRAELMVSSCVQSPTADFEKTYPLLQDGCATSNAMKEKKNPQTDKVKVFQLDLATLITQKNTMYVECMVHLCVALVPSQKCPHQCKKSRLRNLVETMYTADYRVRSGPVFVGDGAGAATTTKIPNAVTKTPSTTKPSSRAPEDRFLLMGVAVGVVCTLLQILLQ